MEQQLKQRLVGAIVLVSLAVIFIPVILEGPRDEWAPRDHTIPEPPGLDYSAPDMLPIPAAEDTQYDTAPERPVKTPVADAPSAAPEHAAVPPPVAEVPPEPPKKTIQDKQEQALKAGWYVQVGSFGQSDNAGRLRDRLAEAGIAAHLQTVGSGKRVAYRVLAGPSGSRASAEKLQASLAASHKLKGLVIGIDADGDG
jgi:DedD protein